VDYLLIAIICFGYGYVVGHYVGYEGKLDEYR